MKFRYSLLLIASLLIFGCGSEKQITLENRKIIENAFTLQLVFGDDDTLGDYLITGSNTQPVAADNGDIIVTDESKLKVFDENGNPKTLVGKPGEGPGEFGRFIFANITENGNICAANNGRLSIFGPDYSLIETINMKNRQIYKNLTEQNSWGDLYFNSMFAFSPEDIFIFTQSMDRRSVSMGNNYLILLYQNSDNVDVIKKFHQDYIHEFKKGDLSYYVYLMEKGGLTFALLDSKKAAYSQTDVDKIQENERWYYLISIYDLESKETKTIKREYLPVAIPDSVLYPNLRADYNGDQQIARGTNRDGTMTTVYQKDMDEKKTELLKDLKYYPPVEWLFSDGKYLFVKTYENDPQKGFIADVFDTETNKYLRSVYLPFRVHFKDGYAYKSGKRDGFPVIEKYKVDPTVYEK
ncbi:hypothetical protein ACFL7D_06810 [candidate division KSB1 bacterium]